MKIIHWLPRVLCILAILFISLFALDSFDPKLPASRQWQEFFMHLIPSFILIIILIIAWKWEWVGTALFIGWAVWYMVFMQGFFWTVYVIIAGLPALIGLLFLAGWIWRKEIQGG